MSATSPSTVRGRLAAARALDSAVAASGQSLTRSAAAAAAADAPAGGGGLFAGLRKAWDDVYKEADAMGYAQAVALNQQLENKGVLPKAAAKAGAAGADPPAKPKPAAKRKKKLRGPKPAAKRGDGFG